MRKQILRQVNTGISFITKYAIVLSMCISSGYAQQSVINQKDNTRPETTAGQYAPPKFNSFAATRWNGYNEIQWSTLGQEETKKFIVEYSWNGVDFQTAGELLVDKNDYSLQHRLLDDRPILYRIKAELLNGKSVHTNNVMLDGKGLSVVKVYPTVISGNTVNIISSWPVERIAVFAENGSQAYVKDIGGQRDYMTLALPTLAKGMYWVTFYGRDWKGSEKIIIP